MDFTVIGERLAQLRYAPLTNASAGRLLYEFVSQPGIVDVLELGFAHGTSTAYMAAALDRKGKGSITTIDRETAREREPNIETLLRQIGLEHWVEPLFAATSYNWELMRILERQTLGEQITPCFDFCFIDGAHSWETDALAFVLVDKLLRPDRWIIFDDVNWTYATSVALRDTERVRRLPEDERNTAQVKKIVDLLVRTHPDYADVRIVGGYGLVYKGGTGEEVHRGDLDRLVRSHGALFRELAFAHLRQPKA